jgi:hypothetical protein
LKKLSFVATVGQSRFQDQVFDKCLLGMIIYHYFSADDDLNEWQIPRNKLNIDFWAKSH